MIKVEDIYNATDGGRLIIEMYYPESKACFTGEKKHFARRNERTPSACVRQFSGVWKVTDFGDQGTAMSPVDIAMAEDNLQFGEAMAKLAGIFGVTDHLDRSVNKPDIRKLPATQDQKDGTRFFELNDSFTKDEMRVMGPRVTQEHLDALHWHSAKYVAYVKNREVVYKYSNEHYPIFMRECLVQPAKEGQEEIKFYKIYEPLNPDKGWRFSYTPEGIKPKDYINGLEELKSRWLDYNKKEEAAFRADPANDQKPYKEKKLPEAFICSGERDSLCVRSLGYNPLWFNSETHLMTKEEYKHVMSMVEVLYNIPDLDSTGKQKGTELALRYIDIHTIWLPEWLSGYKDNRGRGRKDFRDWIDLRTNNQDFRDLMTLAMPAKFWKESWSDRGKKYVYEMDSDCLFYFLRLNGFYCLKDDNLSSPQFIRLQGNIVKKVKPKDIRAFVRQWAEDRALPRDIRNLFINSTKIADSAMDSLKEIDLDFTSYTSNKQLFFFPHCTMEVSGNGIIEHKDRDSDLEHYVWEENVIQHRVALMNDMFTISRVDGEFETVPRWAIDIHDTSSHVFRYLINASRMYWRKELEADISGNDAVDREYEEKHHFSINGERLSEDEISEQMQNLVNKIFAIGYLCHRYKSPSRPWAPQCMDNKIGDEGQCNGRSGKSFLFTFLGQFMKIVKLSGRNPKLMDNPHVFDQVTKHTGLILLDDCDKNLQMGVFYDIITSDLTVNPKNNQSYTIPFCDSPKLGFTTNYVPSDFDPSTDARLIYLNFSDYYHQRTEDNDYLETRTIRDDFNKDLFGQMYDEDEWNADINFLLQCTRFYLSLCESSIKIQPPMENIIKRKYKQDMGTNFEEWAKTYFAESTNDFQNPHLDAFVEREKAFDDFRRYANVSKMTMQKFTKSLKAFCNLCPYIAELNPQEYQNTQQRIIRRREIDGASVEFIYLRSHKAMERKIRADFDEANNKRELPFDPPD